MDAVLRELVRWDIGAKRTGGCDVLQQVSEEVEELLLGGSEGYSTLLGAFALVLTTVATAVLLFHMPTVSAMADAARDATGASIEGLGGDLFHAGVGLVVLLVIQVLNVYKPAGMTRYGWRKLDEQRRRQPAQGAPPLP